MSFLGNIGKALGGGNIMGLALGAASMFFPPLGLASAAMGNLLGNAMGQAIGGAVNQMIQNMGMPNMIGNMIKQIVGDVIGKLQQQVGQQVQDQVGQKFEHALKDFQQQFMRDLLQEVEKLMGKKGGNQGAQNGTAPAAGGAAAGGAAAGGVQSIDQISSEQGVSWFVAVAIALGTAADKQMGKVKDLADKMNTAVAGTKNHSGDDLQKDGMEFQKIGAQMNAESKVLEVITSTMNNTVKSVGDALTAAAKRQ